nr:ribonuclease H-like domain-containing protein [Tanacetum cinerariifolium]
MKAIGNRFGGNAATKKTLKNLLKRQYENFAASSTKMIEQTYERLQKLISQLEMHGEVIPQEDINKKFLRSLLEEWTMYTIMWRNKLEIETLSLDDLFNNLKAYESKGNPQQDLKDKGVIDNGCSRHMTGNISYHTDYEEIDGGFVAFGGNSKGGKITRKGKIRTGKLDFEDVYFVKELNFKLICILQMCEKKNSILFTDTTCVVRSSDIKLTNERHVLLKVPRKDNMYSVDLKMLFLKEVILVSLQKRHQMNLLFGIRDLEM